MNEQRDARTREHLHTTSPLGGTATLTDTTVLSNTSALTSVGGGGIYNGATLSVDGGRVVLAAAPG